MKTSSSESYFTILKFSIVHIHTKRRLILIYRVKHSLCLGNVEFALRKHARTTT